MTQVIPLSTVGLHSYVSPVLATGKDDEPTFQIHIPSYAQRDKMASLLFAHGLIPITPEHGRAVLISEIYEVYAMPAPGEDVPPPGKQLGDPDEIASFLEGYWQRTEIYQEMVGQWAIQEKERLLDIGHGADEADLVKLPQPQGPYTIRETSRAQQISLEMLQHSTKFRELQSRYGDQEANEALMLFRVFVAGWSGFETEPVIHASGKLTAECVEQLRAELAERLKAPVVYEDVVREIRSLMGVDKVTEKNSESPLGIGSSPSGSQASSVESDASGGAWTGSNTEPAPPSASRRTSATSSSSRSARGTKKPKSGQTEGR